MLYSFVHTRVAVLVRHWFEIGLTDGVLEHGARLELRLLEPQAHRGTESAAQRFVIDRAGVAGRPVRPAGPPGRVVLRRALPPPVRRRRAVSDRVFREEITTDPWAWAVAQLSDLDAVADAAGLPPDAVAADAPDVREQAALIADTARSLEASRCTLPGAVLPVDPRRRRHGADHGGRHGGPGAAGPDGRRPLAGHPVVAVSCR